MRSSGAFMMSYSAITLLAKNIDLNPLDYCTQRSFKIPSFSNFVKLHFDNISMDEPFTSS